MKDMDKLSESISGKAKIIIINGQPASGKDALADRLTEFGYEKGGIGEELRRIAGERGLDASDRNVTNQLHAELQEREGRDWFVKRIEKKITENPDTRIVIVGVRSLITMTGIIGLANDHPDQIKLATMALEGSPQIRFSNAQQSPRSRGNTLDEFIAQEEPENHSATNKAGLSVLATMMMCDASFEQETPSDYSYQDDALNWLRKRGML